MKQIIFLTLISISAFAPNLAAADGGPLGFGPEIITQSLETDRPDITEGTQTVTKGHLQLEGGYTFEYDDESGQKTDSHTLPELLIRVGLLDDLEFRFAWEGYIENKFETTDGNSNQEGISDIVVGFKHKMYESTPLHPSLAFILETSLPTGDNDFGADELQPSFKLLWAYDLPKDLSIAGNINFDFPVEENTRYYSQGITLALGYAIDQIGMYGEYFGEFPSSEAPDSSSLHLLNGGFTYAVSDNFQLDIRAGFGLNDEAPDFITGVGFAIRR